MLIETHRITKTFEGNTILSDVSFVIKKGERIGIVGANGSGKTTLLRILAGIEEPDDGSILFLKGTTIGYVPQAPDYAEDQTAKDLLAPLVSTHEMYRVDTAIEALGIADCKEKPLDSLSSGQKTRVYLARILVEERDVLLLDEPTNHLDVEALEWLEQYLKHYHGTVCVVSHDRVFLDAVTNRIFELANGAIKEYGGNYTFYKNQKAIEREAYVRAYEAQQKDSKRLKITAREVKADAERTNTDRKQTRDNDKFAVHFFADRASKKKSSAAKNIEKRLDAIDELERPEKDPKLKMLFTPHELGSQIVVDCKNLTYATPEATIVSNGTFTIERGDRVVLAGRNGTGKTTLIKLMLGQLQPQSGKISLGRSVQVGYLSQEHESLRSSHTVLAELTEKIGIDMTLAHRLLAWLLMPRDKMSQPVNTLSKGEQSKVLLSEIIASGANFIILDEPTNHLDIPAREAVEAALVEYNGTLLVISHDRYFVDAIGITRRMQLRDGALKVL